jgi:hypothetical protein
MQDSMLQPSVHFQNDMQSSMVYQDAMQSSIIEDDNKSASHFYEVPSMEVLPSQVNDNNRDTMSCV